MWGTSQALPGDPVVYSAGYYSRKGRNGLSLLKLRLVSSEADVLLGERPLPKVPDRAPQGCSRGS